MVYIAIYQCNMSYVLEIVYIDTAFSKNIYTVMNVRDVTYRCIFEMLCILGQRPIITK